MEDEDNYDIPDDDEMSDEESSFNFQKKVEQIKQAAQKAKEEAKELKSESIEDEYSAEEDPIEE